MSDVETMYQENQRLIFELAGAQAQLNIYRDGSFIAMEEIAKATREIKELQANLREKMERLAEARAEIARLNGQAEVCTKMWREDLDKIDRLERVLDYTQHDDMCILSYWEAGEPTPDGGYRTKYKGKWYQSNPVDETPRCNCGLGELFAEVKGE
jgi:hypothetical protein